MGFDIFHDWGFLVSLKVQFSVMKVAFQSQLYTNAVLCVPPLILACAFPFLVRCLAVLIVYSPPGYTA